jgi:hypothetical protein
MLENVRSDVKWVADERMILSLANSHYRLEADDQRTRTGELAFAAKGTMWEIVPCSVLLGTRWSCISIKDIFQGALHK